MLPDKKDIIINSLQDQLFSRKIVTVSILRLDRIHPVVSGNKLFKLHYFLEAAVQSTHKTVITFGGAFSNHLVATAFACRELGLKSIGIIRGEKPATISHTLQQCITFGMELKFISRTDYSKKEDPFFLNWLTQTIGEHILIPEGGYHPLGAKGAAMIMEMISNDYSHICCAVGTATTVAGLVSAATNKQLVVGFSALKNMTDIASRFEYLVGSSTQNKNFLQVNDYSFNGYAKHDQSLLQFMNELYMKQHIPTDFVYTGKMLFGIYDMLKTNRLPEGSNIMCIHTGGLQGNLSLPANSLVF